MPTPARPPPRGELGILAGRLAMALRMHSGRRSSIDPPSLASLPTHLAERCRGRRPGPLDTGTPQPFQPWLQRGAAIAAPHGPRSTVSYLHAGAMLQTPAPGSPIPAPLRSPPPNGSQRRGGTPVHQHPRPPQRAPRARSSNAIAMHHTPGSAWNPVPRPISCPPARPSTCSACAATRSPMPFARASSRSTRGWASSGSSPGFSEPRPSTSLGAAPGTCTASP